MPTTDHTLDEILNLAASHFKVPREKLTPDDDFFKTLGIDSLQALDLLTRMEHHFRIELPDYELQGVSDFRRWRTESSRGYRLSLPLRRGDTEKPSMISFLMSVRMAARLMQLTF